MTRKIAAELVTLGGRNNRTYQYRQVVEALANAGLDPKTAREFLPRNAWNRACQVLRKEKVIDVVWEDEDEARFQFSRRFLEKDESDGGMEVKYAKETQILLDKQTGKLSCKDTAVKEAAQRELDRCMDERTNGDITNLCRRLFNLNADLMPLPASTGVYLVPEQHGAFLRKVVAFLRSLGRQPHILPVPADDPEAQQAVQDAMVEYLMGLVEEHRAAVQEFSQTTRQGTLEAHAARIAQTRVKIEAYALQLGELQGALLDAVEEAKLELQAKVNELTGQGEEAAEESPAPGESPAAEETPEPDEEPEPVDLTDEDEQEDKKPEEAEEGLEPQEEEEEAEEEEEEEEYAEMDF